jgi:molybdopterin/thiamine biosynthesis adenylyltransferase
MTVYRPWFDRFPARFSQERAEMAARGFVLNDEALRTERRVEFSGPSQADPARMLVVLYPNGFPAWPPLVFDHTPGKLLTRHHHPATHQLCLFGPGQPRWTASYSGTIAIDEAEHIIASFQAGAPPFPNDDVPEPITASFRYLADAALLVPPSITEACSFVDEGVLEGKFKFQFRYLKHRVAAEFPPLRGVVLEASLPGRAVKAEEPFTSYVRERRFEHGKLVHLPEPPPLLQGPEDLQTWLTQIGVKRQPWMAFVFPEQSGSSTRSRYSWLVLNVSSSYQFYAIHTFASADDEREARIPGLGGLTSKHVVCIGCGSLGSKIAVALAASGVQRFTLVDQDIIKPENAVRHEVGVENYGEPKVDALSRRLISVNPQVYQHLHRLWMQVGTLSSAEDEQVLYEQLAAADLVIDTTGVHGVSWYLNDLCYDLGVPVLYASVTNGAWAGEIVPVIPGRTPCWMCWYAGYEGDRPPSAPMPAQGVIAPGCDQPTFTGTTYEVGVVANLASSMAVETLLREEPGRQSSAIEYLRWIGRDEMGVLRMTTQSGAVQRRTTCGWCGTP